MSDDLIIQDALALMQSLADLSKERGLNSNEIYLAQDLERFVRNQERVKSGDTLNALFVDPKELN